MADIPVPVDRSERIGASTIQHGPLNNRIYLMDPAPEDYPSILNTLDQLQQQHNYSKIFTIIPETMADGFFSRGYLEEARIPGFFRGKHNGLFTSRFHSQERRKRPDDTISKLQQVLAEYNTKDNTPRPLEEGFHIRRIEKQDIPDLCRLFAHVFPRYPFPVQEEKFILSTMEEKTAYFGVWDGDCLAGAASAEKNHRAMAAEMTDFAVLPQYRGKSLGQHLLSAIEDHAGNKGFFTLYTIARLNSTGMNLVFHRGNYRFAGTLVNNTCISRGIESMNVWYKSLSRENQGSSWTPSES